ncbi:MAG: hypothetical protein ACP5DX_12420 [Paracoccaceae bacterium]
MEDQLTMQRLRNRVLEYLELASCFEEQAHYQQTVPHAHVPTEIICQWEDFAGTDGLDWISRPAYSKSEIAALRRFHSAWEATCRETPDPLPELDRLRGDAAWQRLMAAAGDALKTMKIRGRLSESP